MPRATISHYPERRGLEDLLIEMRRAMVERKPGRLAIDSLSVPDRVSSGAAFREFVVALITMVREHRIAAVCTHETAQMTGHPVTNVSTLADCLISLRFGELEDAYTRRARVIKLRGSGHDLADRPYLITDHGTRSLPDRPRAAARPQSSGQAAL